MRDGDGVPGLEDPHRFYSKQANYIGEKGGKLARKGRSGSCAGVGFVRFVMLWRKVTYVHTAKGSRSSGE